MFRYVDDIFSTSRPGVGVNLIYFFFEGVFFFLLTLLIEVHTHTHTHSQKLLQWNSSNPDTNGREESVHISEVS